MKRHHPAPVLLGRRMRTRMRVHGVTVWALRFGGLTVSITHDPKLARPLHSRPYRWQIDAWTKYGVLAGSERTVDAALAKLMRALSGVHHDLLASVKKHNARVLGNAKGAA